MWLPGSKMACSSSFGVPVIAITIIIPWAKPTFNAYHFGCYKFREWSFCWYLFLWQEVISIFMWEFLLPTLTFGSLFTPPCAFISCSSVQESKNATKRNVIRRAVFMLKLIFRTLRRKEICGSMVLVFIQSLFLWVSSTFSSALFPLKDSSSHKVKNTTGPCNKINRGRFKFTMISN